VKEEKTPNMVFDGFCHRPYDENSDGWLMEQPNKNEYPEVSMAKGIISMYKEICELRRENWTLRKRLKSYVPDCP